MSDSELKLPAKPPGARTESNEEILRQLSNDLSVFGSEELTAKQGYRVYRHTGTANPSWGYCLELAKIEASDENLILFRKDKEVHEDLFLDWIPVSNIYTFKNSKLHYVPYIGPTEDVLHEILELFRDVFEFAMKNNWSYEERIEFYHSFPFEDLSTKRSVKAYRRTLFSSPAFDGFEWTFPDPEG